MSDVSTPTPTLAYDIRDALREHRASSEIRSVVVLTLDEKEVVVARVTTNHDGLLYLLEPWARELLARHDMLPWNL